MGTDVVLRCSGPSHSLILMSFKQETRITDNGRDPLTINPACEHCQGRRVNGFTQCCSFRSAQSQPENMQA